MIRKRRDRKWIVVALITIPLLYASCTYEKEDPPDCVNTPATFNAKVLPLITTKCAIAGCHDALTASGGHAFLDYPRIKAAADRIHLRAVVQKTMPATGSLSTVEINTLACWIEAGAINN